MDDRQGEMEENDDLLFLRQYRMTIPCCITNIIENLEQLQVNQEDQKINMEQMQKILFCQCQ